MLAVLSRADLERASFWGGGHELGYKPLRMATAHEWQNARQRIVASPDPWRSRHFVTFYEIAVADGQRALSRYRSIDAARCADLIHELLTEHLDAILHADSPRAFFLTSLTRRAIQWLRRKDARVAPPLAPDDERGADHDPAHGLDLTRTLERLPKRDARIMVAIAMGEDREEVARIHKTTRENVDQIVSRSRRRLAEEP